jgi:succinyl-diaminopimelate desuccinylase
MNAVTIAGGVATNVIPDQCRVTVNYRFAPDLSVEQAWELAQRFFDGYELELTDSAPGALPGLSVPAAAAFVAAVGGEPNPKFGWTDVARFSALGIPAVNFGPGDPMFAHKQDEHVPIAQIVSCEDKLRAWLTGATPA